MSTRSTLTLSLLLLSAPLFGDVLPDVPEVLPTYEEPSFAYKFVQMMAALGLVLGILIAGSWVAKRFFSQRLLQMNSGSSIKILEQRSLSPKAALYLIEVRGKNLLIGESPAGLHPLGEINLGGRQE